MNDVRTIVFPVDCFVG